MPSLYNMGFPVYPKVYCFELLTGFLRQKELLFVLCPLLRLFTMVTPNKMSLSGELKN